MVNSTVYKSDGRDALVQALSRIKKDVFWFQSLGETLSRTQTWKKRWRPLRPHSWGGSPCRLAVGKHLPVSEMWCTSVEKVWDLWHQSELSVEENPHITVLVLTCKRYRSEHLRWLQRSRGGSASGQGPSLSFTEGLKDYCIMDERWRTVRLDEGIKKPLWLRGLLSAL